MLWTLSVVSSTRGPILGEMLRLMRLNMVRRVVLEKVADFRGLSLDSVAELHAIVLGGNLWERLAWRLGREGKPGFHPGGFLEESETWRYISADPEEIPEAVQRTRAARRAARRRKAK